MLAMEESLRKVQSFLLENDIKYVLCGWTPSEAKVPFLTQGMSLLRITFYSKHDFSKV